MKKIILKVKSKINGVLNLKNLSSINNINISKKNVENIYLIYKNEKVKLSEIFIVSIFDLLHYFTTSHIGLYFVKIALCIFTFVLYKIYCKYFKWY